MIALRNLHRTALVAGAFLLSGCHTYLPIDAPRPGSVARVRVPIESAVADPNAPPETVAVEGLVLASGDTIVLAASTRRELGAFREIIQYDTFRVARDGLVSIEAREFSKGRSLALGVIIAGGATGLALVALGFGGGEGGENPGDDGTQQGFTLQLSATVGAILGVFGRARR